MKTLVRKSLLAICILYSKADREQIPPAITIDVQGCRHNFNDNLRIAPFGVPATKFSLTLAQKDNIRILH